MRNKTNICHTHVAIGMPWLSSLRLELFKLFPWSNYQNAQHLFLDAPTSKLSKNPGGIWRQVPASKLQAKQNYPVHSRLLSHYREAPVAASQFNTGSAPLVTCLSTAATLSSKAATLRPKWWRKNDPHPRSAMVALILGTQARNSASICYKLVSNSYPQGSLAQKGLLL